MRRTNQAAALGLVVLLAFGLASCTGGGDGGGPPQPASPTRTPLPLGSSQASQTASASASASGTLQLYVSNQSFADKTVRIRVTVDDAEVVDQRFEVGNQHNWITFPLALPAGARRIEAVSDTGVTLSDSAEPIGFA